jgi:hypothetical protein
MMFAQFQAGEEAFHFTQAITVNLFPAPRPRSLFAKLTYEEFPLKESVLPEL